MRSAIVAYVSGLIGCTGQPPIDPAPSCPSSVRTQPIGACGCSGDADCAAETDAFLAGLTVPFTPDRRYVGAECVARDQKDFTRCCFARPAVCRCYFGWGVNNYERAWQNALVLGNRDSCDVYSRSNLECLYPSSEFPGCDPADAASCDSLCADAVARVEVEAARIYDVERRTSRCDSCYCRSVFRIEDRCYASRVPGAKVYDCSLEDEAILATEYPPHRPTPPPTTSEPPTPPPTMPPPVTPSTDAGEMTCSDR